MVAIFSAPFTPADALLPAMRGHGYAVLGPDAVAGLCGVAVADLDTLKPSWDALPPDEYLLDGGSYRRRRHACFVVDDGRLERAPHPAHWQSTPGRASCRERVGQYLLISVVAVHLNKNR